MARLCSLSKFLKSFMWNLLFSENDLKRLYALTAAWDHGSFNSPPVDNVYISIFQHEYLWEKQSLSFDTDGRYVSPNERTISERKKKKIVCLYLRVPQQFYQIWDYFSCIVLIWYISILFERSWGTLFKNIWLQMLQKGFDNERPRTH